MMERTQSFFLKEPNSNDKIRIFCFPYAGGGASAYRNWGTYLPNYVGVYPIQIPGRENRITEKALTDMCKLTDKIVSAIHPYLDTPYLVFGHSLHIMLLLIMQAKLVKRAGLIERLSIWQLCQ